MRVKRGLRGGMADGRKGQRWIVGVEEQGGGQDGEFLAEIIKAYHQ